MNENRPKILKTSCAGACVRCDAPEGFAERLMAALPAERKPTVVALAPKAARPSLRQFGMPAALAASLLVAVFLGVHVANDRALREEQKGIAASQQLMQALRVTSQKLDLAYEAVNNPPSAGEEENRS